MFLIKYSDPVCKTSVWATFRIFSSNISSLTAVTQPVMKPRGRKFHDIEFYLYNNTYFNLIMKYGNHGNHSEQSKHCRLYNIIFKRLQPVFEVIA